MGMDYPYIQHDITAQAEIEELKRRARHYTKKMRVLEKNEPFTWWGGSSSRYEPSNLDHVVAAEHLQFKGFTGAEVDVRGCTLQANQPSFFISPTDFTLTCLISIT